jgi:prophage regulatory protein
MSDRILIFPQLKSDKGIHYTRQHLARLEKAGKFPQRVQIGANRVGWRESEIDAHVRDLPRGPLPIAPHKTAA